jgi:hypothetical protein
MTEDRPPDLHREAVELLQRRDLRSADRANLQRMVDEIKHGRSLSYQQRQQLWAYINWYRVHP